jgi:glutamate/tyrosine decarboxylase-like PLP-dependent enzyme
MRPEDLDDLSGILSLATDEAVRFLGGLSDQPVAHEVPALEAVGLPVEGAGAPGALALLQERYTPWMSGSAGPRYFGFVTGGTTPAALIGDWLTAAYDQNGSDAGESGIRQLSLDAIGMIRDLLGLPPMFDGVFVTGATTSAVVALATARQWVGHQRGVAVSEEGALTLGPVPVLSGTPHSSIAKALSITGLGRAALVPVPTLPDREAVDVDLLARVLEQLDLDGQGPAIVVANAGTVNTCDFDDLGAIAALKARHPFWLHVDGAFGAVAAASPRYRHLLDGLEAADSITVDAHKWLNVPYDSAVILTRHLSLQGEVFSSLAAYLPTQVRPDTFIHLTPENSQRVRALPVWMTLVAYGRAGYAQLVERCCALAAWLGERIDDDPRFRLLAPVRLNGVCFTLARATPEAIDAFLSRLRRGGTAFLTPTILRNVPAARVSITNWRTDQGDIERTWAAMQAAASESDDSAAHA